MRPWVAPEKRPRLTVQHLAHSRPARRAFVTDDDDVAGGDASRLHGREARLLGIEDARWTAVQQSFVPRELHDAALGSEVASQNRKPSGRL